MEVCTFFADNIFPQKDVTGVGSRLSVASEPFQLVEIFYPDIFELEVTLGNQAGDFISNTSREFFGFNAILVVIGMRLRPRRQTS